VFQSYFLLKTHAANLMCSCTKLRKTQRQKKLQVNLGIGLILFENSVKALRTKIRLKLFYKEKSIHLDCMQAIRKLKLTLQSMREENELIL